MENCLSRAWEPHKYASLEAQKANLEMLIEWVKEYETREDEFSMREHRKLYEEYKGEKVEYRTKDEARERILLASSKMGHFPQMGTNFERL